MRIKILSVSGAYCGVRCFCFELVYLQNAISGNDTPLTQKPHLAAQCAPRAFCVRKARARIRSRAPLQLLLVLSSPAALSDTEKTSEVHMMLLLAYLASVGYLPLT